MIHVFGFASRSRGLNVTKFHLVNIQPCTDYVSCCDEMINQEARGGQGSVNSHHMTRRLLCYPDMANTKNSWVMIICINLEQYNADLTLQGTIRSNANSCFIHRNWSPNCECGLSSIAGALSPTCSHTCRHSGRASYFTEYRLDWSQLELTHKPLPFFILNPAVLLTSVFPVYNEVTHRSGLLSNALNAGVCRFQQFTDTCQSKAASSFSLSSCVLVARSTVSSCCTTTFLHEQSLCHLETEKQGSGGQKQWQTERRHSLRGWRSDITAPVMLWKCRWPWQRCCDLIVIWLKSMILMFIKCLR